jgi:hypothetical protein
VHAHEFILNTAPGGLYSHTYQMQSATILNGGKCLQVNLMYTCADVYVVALQLLLFQI